MSGLTGSVPQVTTIGYRPTFGRHPMSFNTFGHMFRVATCAIARKILPNVTVRGALVQMGPHKINRDNWDWDEIARNPFFCPDKEKAAFFEDYLDGIRKKGSSIGAVIEVVADGVPAGLGAPIYAKLRAGLATALMRINPGEGGGNGAGFGGAGVSGEAKGDGNRRGN